MKLVIEIDEENYRMIQDKIINDESWGFNLSDIDIAISEGKPLDAVLDEIRAEIQENINYNKKMNYQGIVAGLLLTLYIIDKYKAERGGEE